MDPYIPPSAENRIEPAMPDIAELIIKHGVKKRIAKPFTHRILWKLGIGVRPPLYSTSNETIVISGIPTGLVWGVMMKVLFLDDVLWGKILIISLLYGIGIGISTRWSFNRFRRKKDLPEWDTLIELARK